MEEAEKLIEERAQLLNASEEDFTQALTKFDGYLVQVLRVKNSRDKRILALDLEKQRKPGPPILR